MSLRSRFPVKAAGAAADVGAGTDGGPTALRPRSSAPQVHAGVDDLDAALAELTGRDVEVRLETREVGEVWLVPEPTGRDRAELTFGDVRALSLVREVFPGAHAVALRRNAKKSQ